MKTLSLNAVKASECGKMIEKYAERGIDARVKISLEGMSYLVVNNKEGGSYDS